MGLRHRQYLEEATFNMDRDVDWLYKRSGFDKFHGVLASGDDAKIEKVFRPLIDGRVWMRAESGDLRSRVARKAHKVNPVSIFMGVHQEGSFYKPLTNEVQITLNLSAINLIREAIEASNSLLRTTSVTEYLKNILGTQYRRFVLEFNAGNIKGTILHELSHWASDSLHNRNVLRTIQTGMAAHAAARERGEHRSGQDYLRGKFPTVGQHPMEIDAQVHAIRAIRGTMSKREFDRLTWKDLLSTKSSLMSNLRISPREFLSSSDYTKTLKRLVKRLHREGLLGKGLRKLPSRFEFAQIAATI